jgi:hypothetical protein
MQTEPVKIRGFFRTCLTDVAGPHKGRVQMSDWHKNLIVTEGLTNYICGRIGGIAGSKVVGFMQLASQTAAVNATQLVAVGAFTGTDGARAATTNTFASAGTVQFVGSFATNIGNQSAVGAVALHAASDDASCASVGLFTASQKTTAQTLAITYQYRLTTA